MVAEMGFEPHDLRVIASRRLAVPEKMLADDVCSIFSTAAEIAPCLHLPPAAAGRNSQRAVCRRQTARRAITRRSRSTYSVSVSKKKADAMHLLFFLVAEMGFEPHDLRVMSCEA